MNICQCCKEEGSEGLVKFYPVLKEMLCVICYDLHMSNIANARDEQETKDYINWLFKSDITF